MDDDKKYLDTFSRFIERGQHYQRRNPILSVLKKMRARPYALPRIVRFRGGVRKVSREESIKVLGIRELLPETYKYRFDLIMRTIEGFETLLDLADDHSKEQTL